MATVDPADYIPEGRSIYGYVPTKSITLTFLTLFALSSIIHIVLALKFRRMWFLWLTIVFCSVGETIGWGGRVISSYDVFNITGFRIQISCTIFSPTYTLAGVFVILGRIIRLLGTQYSRMSPRLFTTIFVVTDTVALVIQAVGGGIASSIDPFKGANIMLAGIVFQLAILIFATAFSLEYLIRFWKDIPFSGRESAPPPPQIPKRVLIMLIAMGTILFLIFVRAIYRTIELSEGWVGPIINTELYFNLFDGAPILIAQYILIFVHPGFFLPQEEPNKNNVSEEVGTVSSNEEVMTRTPESDSSSPYVSKEKTI